MSEQSLSIALDREDREMCLDNEKIAIEVKDWDLYYGSNKRLIRSIWLFLKIE